MRVKGRSIIWTEKQKKKICSISIANWHWADSFGLIWYETSWLLKIYVLLIAEVFEWQKKTHIGKSVSQKWIESHMNGRVVEPTPSCAKRELNKIRFFFFHSLLFYLFIYGYLQWLRFPLDSVTQTISKRIKLFQ